MDFCQFIDQEVVSKLDKNIIYQSHCVNLETYKDLFKKYTNKIDEICKDLNINSFYDNEIKFREMRSKFCREKASLEAVLKEKTFGKKRIYRQIVALDTKECLAGVGLQYSLWQDEMLRNIKEEISEIREIEIKEVEKFLKDNLFHPLIQNVVKTLEDESQQNEKVLNSYYGDNKFVKMAIGILKNYCNALKNQDNFQTNEFFTTEQIDVDEKDCEL